MSKKCLEIALRNIFNKWLVEIVKERGIKTVIPGAKGCIGAALRKTLSAESGHQVVSVTRRADTDAGDERYVLDLCTERLPEGSLTGVDAVVHTAVRVYVMRDRAADPLAECRRTNRDEIGSAS